MATIVVDSDEARRRLLELIRATEDGDEVIVTRSGAPVARLIAWESGVRRRPGAWAGRIEIQGSLVGPDVDVLEMFDSSDSHD